MKNSQIFWISNYLILKMKTRAFLWFLFKSVYCNLCLGVAQYSRKGFLRRHQRKIRRKWWNIRKWKKRTYIESWTELYWPHSSCVNFSEGSSFSFHSFEWFVISKQTYLAVAQCFKWNFYSTIKGIFSKYFTPKWNHLGFWSAKLLFHIAREVQNHKIITRTREARENGENWHRDNIKNCFS